MKKILLLISAIAVTFTSAAQAPTLGAAADFALFSTNGAVSNTGMSHITGHVGTNNGSSTNFGNVDGVMNDANGASAAAAASLTLAYNQLLAAIPGFFPAPLLGNGQTLTPGTYSIGQSATLNGNLILDGQNAVNPVFIFKIQGSFSSAANAQVQLINGAQACNIFWKIEGLVDLAANTVMKGTIIANNAAIILNTGTSVEGRALSTTGAVTISGATVRKPIGCGSLPLTGPAEPPLNSVACFTIFSGNGAVTNTGITYVTGDVGTNVGLTTGFNEDFVAGEVHENPDTETAQCALDLNNVYSFLNTIPVDIQLLYPAALGQNLVLTPHTYHLDAATVLTGTMYFNAQGNEDAVFVMKINGALSTSTFANIELLNGAKAENIYWKVDGAVNINDNSHFKGTVIGNGGAVILNTGVQIEGRVLSTGGGVSTFAIIATMTPGCETLAVDTVTDVATKVQFYPNPFSSSVNVVLPATSDTAELVLYNAIGATIMKTQLNQTHTNLSLDVTTGLYLYTVQYSNGTVETGKLIAK